MSRNEGHTSASQQRINLRNSKAKLNTLLAANFQDGAQLVTLTYWAGTHAPSHRLAVLQISDWLRAARRSSQSLRYIRTIEQKTPRHYPVHRIVIAQSEPVDAALTALWGYGPVTSETVQKGDLEGLAARLTAPGARNEQHGGHMWSASRGLIRPRKENKQ